MYQKLNTVIQSHPNLPVVVSRKQGRPAMYYWFCNQIDPRLVQAANPQAKKDQGELLEFGQLTFSDSPSSPAIVATFSGETGWQINVP
jgi:hypothetical protein